MGEDGEHTLGDLLPDDELPTPQETKKVAVLSQRFGITASSGRPGCWMTDSDLALRMLSTRACELPLIFTTKGSRKGSPKRIPDR